MAYSEALDQICPAVVDHHKDVAYWSGLMADRLGMERDQRTRLVQAALLHDIGIFSMKGRLESLSFEFELEKTHAEAGAMLLEYTPYFSEHGKIIRHHHDCFNEVMEGCEIPLESQIIFMVDRVAVMVDKTQRILVQRRPIWAMLEEQKGKKFNPQLVDGFKEILYQDDLWLNLQHHRDTVIRGYLGNDQLSLAGDDLESFGKLFIRAIDFRSRHTAAHSVAVAYVVSKLTELLDFTDEKKQLMLIAGYFHDIGKVIVPSEILDKPDIITREEMEIIREHPYYTHRILEALNGIGRYSEIAAQHHEKYDGSGYPYHLNERDLHPESMLLTVADIFTALTETRSYRKGMNQEETFKVLDFFQRVRSLDVDMINLIKENYIPLRDGIIQRHQAVFEEYEDFDERIRQLNR